MSLIKKAVELEITANVKVMIFGVAGAGKTTLALSSPDPLLLDFDGGVKRVNREHVANVDIVQVSSWKDIKDLFNEDLTPYKTIVVDTIGKMMDFIIAYCCDNRQPSIKDWGRINAEFQWFSRALNNLNKHIVYVAHRDTRKEGDENVFIPALREKSYNAIVTELDLLGYYEVKNKNGVQTRTLTFNPTSRNDGKNTCNLPSEMSVPMSVDGAGNTIGENNFILEQIIKPYNAMIARKQQDVADYKKLMDTLTSKIDAATNAAELNEFCKNINKYKHIGSSKMKAAALVQDKAKALNLKYNKSTKSYEENRAEESAESGAEASKG